MTVPEPATRVWRQALFGRAIASVLIGVALLGLVAVWTATLRHPSVADALHALAATGGLGLYGGFAWWMALRPKLVLTDDEVVVVNPWGTTRVPLADVVSLSGGFTGAYLQRRDGWSVRVFALAEAYGGGRSQRPRVAEVAEVIADRRRLRAPQPPAARG